MDSNVQVELETLGAGFEDVLKGKFLATKGRSKVNGTGGVFGGMKSKICPYCFTYHAKETRKAEAIVKQIEKRVEKKLRILERSFKKGK